VFSGTPAPDALPWHWIALADGTGVALRQTAERAGVPLKTVLLAAHLRVLAVLAGGADEVVTGYVTSGRPEADDGDRVLGVFLNTVPLRVRMEAGSWRALLRRVWSAEERLVAHRRFPLAEIVREAGGRRPFEAAFNFNNFHVYGDLAAAGVELSGDRFFQRTELPLLANASVDPATGELRLRLEYDPARLAPATVQAIGGLYRAALQAAAHPDAPWDAGELVDAAEQARLRRLAEGAALDFERRAIHQAFERQAARTPDATALVADDATLSYRELNERANRLAHHLRRLGVGPEARVGVCLTRGAELLVSLLGVLKAGGAYVPLDPAYPAERLRATLDDSGAAVLLTESSLASLLPASPGVRVVEVDRAAAEIARERADDPRSGVSPRNLAYLIYTSGSTGAPKGVAIEHDSAVALLEWAWSVYSDAELGGVLASTSVCFDLSVFELFAPLGRGGRVILVENALALPRAAAAEQVRLVDTVPSAAAALLRTGGIPRGVTTVTLAGEPLRAELADALYAHGVERVYDLYGPSEDTTFSTYALRRPGGPETIGRPIANTQAHVLDAALRPVPAGLAGELCLGGAGVARGYLGRPGATAERFVPDPFSTKPGARMYRTGDRARWREDGTLEYLGRLDHQVKIRGFRIETGEIEAVLRRHPGVRECVVAVPHDSPGDPRLVAYVVGGAGTDDLRAHLRRTLPEHMLPAAFVPLDALPLTPNGKLDRRALPAPEAGGAEVYVAPRTEVERVLAETWAHLLRVERVGARDDFFALGGHSLLGTRLISRVRAALDVELPLRALFDAPTVEALAGRVEALRRAGLPVLPPVEAVERTGPVTLSFAQERLWFLDRLEPESAFYNIPAAFRLGGPLDVGALERAVGEVVRRHQALRTVFHEVEGVPAQVIAPFAGFSLPVEDLSALDGPAREAEVRRRADQDAARPFDLSRGPLLRVTLLRLAAEEHVLLLCMHHVASDGWSRGVLFRELSALYAAFAEGGESPLPDLPVQYADYAAWQRRVLRGEALDARLAWWTERLAGAPALLELPTDHPRPAMQTYVGAQEAVRLPGELLQGLRALGRGEGATHFMVLLGAFQVLLSRYGGGDDVVVGSPVAGRTRPELEGLIGFFVNTLVLRTDLSGDPAFGEVLRRAREAVLGAYEHQDVPFERLVEALQPERSLSHSPLFQVMFSLVEDRGETLRLGTVERLPTGTGATAFDLSLTMVEEADGLRGVVEYRPELFEAATVRRMMEHLAALLAGVAADPGQRVSRLPLLGAGERRRVLEEWNATAYDAPRGCCIQDVIAERARTSPDAAAAETTAGTLS
ncbi:MAG TPA: amino acid adenylation domain-containing protein, partial [Longimicrobium sp.]|nr:amino acid adenylation domain-containing protein [Longimicrobium sp.]